jgi:hypothetical protein
MVAGSDSESSAGEGEDDDEEAVSVTASDRAIIENDPQTEFLSYACLNGSAPRDGDIDERFVLDVDA